MMIISWLFDKIGYMPKVSVDSTWHFPATQKNYTLHEFEKPIAKKVAKKTVSKTTARPKKPKK